MNRRNSWMFSVALMLIIAPALCSGQDAVFRLKSAGGSSKLNGKISNISPKGVSIDGREVPAAEIKRLAFNKEPSEINRAREQMNSGQFSDAIEELKKITNPVRSKALQAEIDFINAYSTAQISLRGGNIPAQSAGKTVGAFISKHGESLHLYPATEQYGKLIFAFGRPQTAVEQFGRLSNCEWPEYKLKGNFLKGQALIELGKFAEATAAFDAILAIQSNDDLSQTYKLLAQCGKAKVQGLQGNAEVAKKAIEDLIRKEDSDKNKLLFANLYNALGAVHEKAGQAKEASMAYLHTEVLYASQAEAHAEALYRLALLWPKLEDTDRANRARDTLKTRYRNSYWANKL